MLLSKITHILGFGGDIAGDREIGWLLTDSRSLTFPAESLFFALVTNRNNGHQYVQELYNQGLRAFVISEVRDEFETMQDALFLLVDDTLMALQQIAAAHRREFSIPIIGITGSNGKTIVKEWLFQLLHEECKIVRSPRSYNSQIGVPLSVWQLRPDTQLGIFEAGISMPGEMAKLEHVVRPTIGIFTNIGDAHQENFISQQQKITEKLKLFTHAKVLIYNEDNPHLDAEIKQAGLDAALLSWGQQPDCYLQLLSINKSATQTELVVKRQYVQYTFQIPFTDDASVENAMHCIACLIYQGYNVGDINSKLSQLERVAMRLEVKHGVQDCLIINDSYNADLNALNIALDFLSQQSVSKQLSKTIILSDILQSGFQPDVLYQKVAELILARNCHRFIGIGDEICRHAAAFSAIESYFFPTTESFLNDPISAGFRHEAILLKGSRKFGFEQISHKLELIAHETVLEVNLNALVDNLNYFRSKLRRETKIMSMVKAFAYGSGSVEIAKTLQHHRVDYLAVAVADEGAELRRAGIRIPIVVMNPEKSAFDVLFENNLEPEIYSFNLLKAFMEAAGKLALTDYPIHVKIDTGMHRLGFDAEEVDGLIELLKSENQVKVRSVFSHLAGADEPRLDDFTRQQVGVLNTCADKFSKAFPHRILKHILNSAGTERFPEFQFDMVRLGIGHYGISALPEVKLRQVCALKTIVLQLKQVKAGETVGYSRNGIATEDKLIAMLPIGYADGYNRKLGNGLGEVLVKGKRARVFGNVSMDLIAIDVTGMDVQEGDTVEIFGDYITIAEMADKLNTIPYEILTGVSRRVKRVYFSE